MKQELRQICCALIDITNALESVWEVEGCAPGDERMPRLIERLDEVIDSLFALYALDNAPAPQPPHVARRWSQ